MPNQHPEILLGLCCYLFSFRNSHRRSESSLFRSFICSCLFFCSLSRRDTTILFSLNCSLLIGFGLGFSSLQLDTQRGFCSIFGIATNHQCIFLQAGLFETTCSFQELAVLISPGRTHTDRETRTGTTDRRRPHTRCRRINRGQTDG